MNLLGRENTLVRLCIEWVPQGEAGGGGFPPCDRPAEAGWTRVSNAAIDRHITYWKLMERSHYGEQGV